MDSKLPATLCYTGRRPRVITKCMVREGDFVGEDVLYKIEKLELKSPFGGCIRKIFKKTGDITKKGDLLCLIDKCTHPITLKDICMNCGIAEQCTAKYFLGKLLDLKYARCVDYYDKDLGNVYTNELLSNKKLALIVDLDNTMIHTNKDDVFSNMKDVLNIKLWDMNYNLKLRPHTERFLKNISKYYHLNIFTMATKGYANAIVKKMDPEGKYFGNRIFSREDSNNPKLKSSNLELMFPCGDNMVCMIDDRNDVWESRPNLIKVKKYSFFDHAHSDKSIGSDELGHNENKSLEDKDDYLLHLEKILLRIHALFYQESRNEFYKMELRDLKRIMPQERSRVFHGCNIYFSGFENSEINFQFLLNYGANIHPVLVPDGDTDKTTHVVAMNDGSEDVVRALNHKICTVNMEWLLDCCQRWERVDESLYPITKLSVS